MPKTKIKTCKTAAKRFEVSGRGKIRHGATGMNHLKLKKTKSGKRRLSIKSTVTSGQKRVIKRLVPGIV
ncbi:MAG: bL35 family ribosomal protein [Armatimonadota bacterium]|nr:bL35 family ribosomal protein [Armatimonadota bacterium]